MKNYIRPFDGPYRRKPRGKALFTFTIVVFFGLTLGLLLYGLYNAYQIEKVSRNECVVVHDPTC